MRLRPRSISLPNRWPGHRGAVRFPIAPVTTGAATLGQRPLGSTLMMHAGLTHGGSHRVRCPSRLIDVTSGLLRQRSRIYPAFGQNRRPAEGRLVEEKHWLDDLAGLHVSDSLINLGKRVGLHQPLDRQAPAARISMSFSLTLL